MAVENLWPCDCAYYSCETFNSEFGEVSSSKISIIHHNIRSFSKNADELLAFISDLLINCEIIVLTETWFHSDSLIDIEGYIGFHSFRACKAGGGVSIFVRSTLSVSCIDALTLNLDFIESTGVQIKLEDFSVFVLGIYRPPCVTNIDMFFDSFSDLLTEFNAPNKYVYIVGDFNINMLSNDGMSGRLTEIMSSSLFSSLISLPTRLGSSSETLIDNIWTNNDLCVRSGVFTVDITDHFPIFCTLSNGSFKSTILKRFRDHSEESLAKLENCVSDYVNGGCSEVEMQDINYRTNSFLNKFLELYNVCCPIKVKCLSVKSICKPWISDYCKLLIKRKHSVFRQYKSGYISPLVYNNFRNYVTGQIRNEKRDYYRNKLSRNNSDARRVWAVINELIGRPNKDTTSYTLETASGVNVDCPATISNMFSNYFTSSVTQLRESIPPGMGIPTAVDELYVAQQSFSARPTDVAEVVSVISSFRSSGCNIIEIPVFIYKKLVLVIAPTIVKLFNDSISEGVYPDILKIGKIVPIFKSGNRKLVKNFRPISTLSIMNKIFEKLMHKRIMCYLNEFSLLANCQYGFRSMSSTADAIAEFLDNVYSTIDRREYLIAIFLDLSKAFDTVDHSILLNKLESKGIRGVTLEWFRSYLSDRRQYVTVSGHTSDTVDVVSGVPQGSILGPVLFNIYIDDMHGCCSLGMIHYADDTTLFTSGADIVALVSYLNAELLRVDDWLKRNRLFLNVSKSKAMMFTKRKQYDLSDVILGGVALSFSDSIKFLGVTIDTNVNFGVHGSHILRRLSMALGAMRKLSYYAPHSVILSVYYSLFYCHLTYAVIVWGNSSANLVRKISSLQRQAVRLLDWYSPYSDIFTRFRLLEFKFIYKYFCVVALFNILRGCNTYFSGRIENTQVSHSHDTRGVADFALTNIRCRTACSQRNFLFHAISLWNDLPLLIRQLPNIHQFKRDVKIHYLAEQYSKL